MLLERRALPSEGAASLAEQLPQPVVDPTIPIDEVAAFEPDLED